MIRLAMPKHLESINAIYNQAVEDGLRTAHTDHTSFTERKLWFQDHSEEQHPIFVEERNDTILGWLSISPYRSDRQALNEVVEVSYYVDYEHHGCGIGTKLMNHGVQFCSEKNYRLMVAILVSENEPSLALLRKFGFNEGGRIPNAIHYGDAYRDHVYMYKSLE